jgi:hypothetical protein
MTGYVLLLLPHLRHRHRQWPACHRLYVGWSQPVASSLSLRERVRVRGNSFQLVFQLA